MSPVRFQASQPEPTEDRRWPPGPRPRAALRRRLRARPPTPPPGARPALGGLVVAPAGLGPLAGGLPPRLRTLGRQRLPDGLAMRSGSRLARAFRAASRHASGLLAAAALRS